MKNSKSLVELLDSIDTSYLCEAEKNEAIAKAKRAEFVADAIVAIAHSVKAFFKSLIPHTMKHA